MGIKDFSVISNGNVYENINKSHKIRKLEKKLRREQRCFSRKYENLKKEGEPTQKKEYRKTKVKGTKNLSQDG